jgi:hypothetical protein
MASTGAPASLSTAAGHTSSRLGGASTVTLRKIVTMREAALGRFPTNVGMAPQAVAAVGFAVERMGGSAQDAQGSIDAMAKSLYDLHTNGKALPDSIYRLQALSGVSIDSEHGLPKFMNDIAEAVQKLSKIDPAQARFLLQGAGINDATANAMIKYGSGLTDVAIDLAPTDKAIKAAQDLTASFAGAQEAVRSVGSAVAEQLDEPLTKMLDALSTWIEDNKQLEASNIVKWLDGVGERLVAIAEFAKARIDEFDAVVAYLKSSRPAGQVAAIANKFGPQQPGTGEATPIPWGQWWNSTGQFFRNQHTPDFDISAHAGELAPGIDQGAFESRRGKAFSSLGDSGLTIQGQQISRGNPMPVDVVRVAGQGADANSLLGGPIGSGGAPPAGAGLGSGHSSSDGLRARGTPGGGGSGPNVTPQPDDTVQSLRPSTGTAICTYRAGNASPWRWPPQALAAQSETGVRATA